MQTTQTDFTENGRGDSREQQQPFENSRPNVQDKVGTHASSTTAMLVRARIPTQNINFPISIR